MNIEEMQKAIHETAVSKGWWEPQVFESLATDGPDGEIAIAIPVKMQRTFGDMIALCHSELSEALEAYREKGIDSWQKLKLPTTLVAEVGRKEAERLMKEDGFESKPEGAFVELADCIIRILDMAGYFNISMEDLILEKMKYNETRSHRHGGKKL